MEKLLSSEGTATPVIQKKKKHHHEQWTGSDGQWTGANGSPTDGDVNPTHKKHPKQKASADGQWTGADGAANNDLLINMIAKIIKMHPKKVESLLKTFQIAFPANPTEHQLAIAVTHGLSMQKGGRAFAKALLAAIKEMATSTTGADGIKTFFGDDGTVTTGAGLAGTIAAGAGALDSIGNLFGGKAKAQAAAANSQAAAQSAAAQAEAAKASAQAKLLDALNTKKGGSTSSVALYAGIGLAAAVLLTGVIIFLGKRKQATAVAA